MTNRMGTAIVLLGLAQGLAGCGGSPTGPQSSGSALTVTAISPNSGSTLGDSVVSIHGTGFRAGATVTLGGAATNVNVASTTLIAARVPAHGAGTVDVIVTNPGGSSSRLSGGYTYFVVPPISVAPISVTEISPSAGSTDGGTYLTITGTGFQRGVTVTVGGIQRSIHLENAVAISLTAPGHVAGDVDVVVTNLDGQTATLIRGYTYALPQSFDFNGDWEGIAARGDYDESLRFTIRNNALTSISCGSSGVLLVTLPAPISNGQFSFSSDEAISMSGRILSASQATGAIKIPPCGESWFARKR